MIAMISALTSKNIAARSGTPTSPNIRRWINDSFAPVVVSM